MQGPFGIPMITLIEAREMAARNEPLPEDFYIDPDGEVQVKPGRYRQPRDELQRLADWCVDDILSLTDEEVLAEVREDGGDPIEIASAAIRIWEAVRAQCRGDR